METNTKITTVDNHSNHKKRHKFNTRHAPSIKINQGHKEMKAKALERARKKEGLSAQERAQKEAK